MRAIDADALQLAIVEEGQVSPPFSPKSFTAKIVGNTTKNSALTKTTTSHTETMHAH